MFEVASNWRSVGASVVGSSHRANAGSCEDAHAYRLLANQVWAAAVADGAGSAERAAEGANFAVRVALEASQNILAQNLPTQPDQWETVLLAILRQVRAGLEELAKEDAPLTLRDFATTLLVALVTPEWIATVQVGDGAIVGRQTNGNLQTLTFPDHSEYLNETTFVTSDDYLVRTQIVIQPAAGIDCLALLTDGLQMLALNMRDNTAYAPFFGPLFRFAANPDANEAALNARLAAFLDSERVADATDDDKTLVLAVRI